MQNKHALFSPSGPVVEPSILGERLELLLSGWTGHSWQRAVCLSADRSISSGWRTDRWRLCRLMSRKKHSKNYFSARDRAPLIWDERLMLKWEHGRPWSNPHLLAQCRLSVKLPKINREQNRPTRAAVSLSLDVVFQHFWCCPAAPLFSLRKLLVVQIVYRWF